MTPLLPTNLPTNLTTNISFPKPITPSELLKQLLPDLDVVIVGAGINGIGVFRDCVKQGLSCLLIDRQDFCAVTSAQSSKMLHGGLRYLLQADLPLVEEALREKYLWQQLLPQYCREAVFHLPIYRNSPFGAASTYLGLSLYRQLAGPLGTPVAMLNKTQALQQIPSLNPADLQGCGQYRDSLMEDHHLGLACLQDALYSPWGAPAQARSYIELKSIQNNADHPGQRLQLFDHFYGETFELNCAKVVFTLGPYTDLMIPRLLGNEQFGPHLALSRGGHLWLKNTLQIQHPLVMQDHQGRVIFVNPQKEALLVGTTELPVNAQTMMDWGNWSNLKADDRERDYLWSYLNHYFPALGQYELKDLLLGTFSGLRPLVRLDTSQPQGLGKISRHHHIFAPTQHSLAMAGGKYTTFRTMAQDVVRLLCAQLKRPYSAQRTLEPLRLPGSGPSNFLISPEQFWTHLQAQPEQLPAFLKDYFIYRPEDLALRLRQM